MEKKEEDIIAVAKFMDMEPVYSGKQIMGWQKQKGGRMVILGDYRPYDDWNELMAVVEKINQNPTEVDIAIEAKGCWLTFSNEGRVEKALINKFPLIECVWRMVVEFVKSHNTQSSQTTKQ